MVEKFLAKNVITRSEVCKLLGVSMVTIYRRFKEMGIKPIEQTIYKQKHLYLIDDIEKAFNFKIRQTEEEQESFLNNDKKIEKILRED